MPRSDIAITSSGFSLVRITVTIIASPIATQIRTRWRFGCSLGRQSGS